MAESTSNTSEQIKQSEVKNLEIQAQKAQKAAEEAQKKANEARLEAKKAFDKLPQPKQASLAECLAIENKSRIMLRKLEAEKTAALNDFMASLDKKA